ncbi:hypothetical protein NX02_16765 [Sphingomonas sanxanigenens DSM 19645 = NX02]|uniref:Phosphoesterase n=1 Tax=Sphingomonas sanxanigenens DSM 19645 = NX02 TaxID=1123269 RepID=W0AD79_9SPHN|nr:hypothetical protein NX02_16765 [Sphingomonas sanxanigenens DSM 19645 = NX02]
MRGVGSFHKTLPHNEFGEVDAAAFAALVSATRGDGSEFAQVPGGAQRDVTRPKPDKPKLAAAFTNPQGGLASDRLIHHPAQYAMPPAPGVTSNTTAAEMLELYWMAALRDLDVGQFDGSATTADPLVGKARKEINKRFKQAIKSSFITNDSKFEMPAPPNSDGPEDRFILGLDVAGSSDQFLDFSDNTLFRLGLPGDEVGPMISQFFLRPARFGTQRIDQRQRPYAAGLDYLTDFGDWLAVQNSGRDDAGNAYPGSNEAVYSATAPDEGKHYEQDERYISTMRDLARFVNKDALHQAYFNAALILLSGAAKWPLGNPYHDVGNSIVKGALPDREAGFGVLGGPHILALVSEVATRALKVVWRQKWQVNLRLRPEAYGGLVHVQNLGVGGRKRDYGLPRWICDTDAIKEIKSITRSKNGGGAAGETMLLPMAFSAGSPTHPAYGAGHATVAGACVTVLKAFFMTFTTEADGADVPIAFGTLEERDEPYGKGRPITVYRPTAPSGTPLTGHDGITYFDNRIALNQSSSSAADKAVAEKLTIEGELNKLAQNVAMGRSMGGVHWRTDNTRSLMLGEALAAEMLAQITSDVNEAPSFTFRSFARDAKGKPRKVEIARGRIFVNGNEKTIPVGLLY